MKNKEDMTDKCLDIRQIHDICALFLYTHLYLFYSEGGEWIVYER